MKVAESNFKYEWREDERYRREKNGIEMAEEDEPFHNEKDKIHHHDGLTCGMT